MQSNHAQTRALRWTIQDAVIAQKMPALSKLIMLTLLTRADVTTCTIPERFSPSYSELGKLTGLSRRAVVKYVKALVADGWLARTVPTNPAATKDTNVYRPTLPKAWGLVHEAPEVGAPDAPAQTGQVTKPQVAAGARGALVHEVPTFLDLRDSDHQTAPPAETGPPSANVPHPRHEEFSDKRDTKPATIPILASRGVTLTEQHAIINRVQQLAREPIGNFDAYLTAMDRRSELGPLIAEAHAPARERAQRAAHIPQYLLDLEARRNGATSRSDEARAHIRATLTRVHAHA